MTLSLTLPPEVEAKLLQRAAESRQSPDDYASRVLVEAVGAPTVDELLAPARKQIADSGMSDAEFDHFFDDLREKVWREKGSRGP
jgi:hypothetical protein